MTVDWKYLDIQIKLLTCFFEIAIGLSDSTSRVICRLRFYLFVGLGFMPQGGL